MSGFYMKGKPDDVFFYGWMEKTKKYKMESIFISVVYIESMYYNYIVIYKYMYIKIGVGYIRV